MTSTLSTSRPNTAKSKAHTSPALGPLKWIFRLLYNFSSTLWVFIVRLSCGIWSGYGREEPKVITHRASAWRAVKKCAVHFVPIAATVVLAGVNIGTYFVGGEYKGYDSGRWQDFDKLALQLAAKLYVSTASYKL